MTADEILKKHEDENEMHFHEVDRRWIIQAMEEYAALHKAEVSTPHFLKDAINKLLTYYTPKTIIYYLQSKKIKSIIANPALSQTKDQD